MTVAIRMLAAIVVVGLLLVPLWPAAARGHEPASSTVFLDVLPKAVVGELQLPVSRLAVAAELPSASAPADVVGTHGDRLRSYLESHVAVTGEDGRPWRMVLGAFSVDPVDGLAYVPVRFEPPDGKVTPFSLKCDVIVGDVKSHKIVVVVSRDGGEQSVVGVLNHAAQQVRIDAGTGDVGFGAMVRHGFDHVREGADHLLFLLVLLLPAPLVARSGRWRPSSAAMRPFWRLLHVVTAFTIGHSVTLVASALGWVDVSGRLVEVVIAVSVGIGAVHAFRPLVGDREALIAGVFGLVHGLAFAGILNDLGVGRSASLTSLFGFNTGIELAQVTAIALLFPSLYVLSRTKAYGIVRIGGASVALLAATGWIIDRLDLGPNIVEPVEAFATGSPLLIAGPMAGFAIGSWLVERRRPNPLS